ncbi:hypothetical protein CALCODRAFT_500388 [Calocera cornea HHB12733]|uniref:Uncharacterized protein n=1 Tax=Calocera cornea HHB12733 TaxID=1353952 RepID=A0A165E3X9_9BASI|nr:hypothetical protein CALCODRAFT_500388 [Calocera cornea HHB12733]
MPATTRKVETPAAAAVPFTKESKDQLQQAIKTVSEERLRNVVAELVRKEPGAEKELMKALVVSRRKRKRGDEALELLSRWETCANCKVEFDVGEERVEKECRYHDGAHAAILWAERSPVRTITDIFLKVIWNPTTTPSQTKTIR